jgi:hypothetical protein
VRAVDLECPVATNAKKKASSACRRRTPTARYTGSLTTIRIGVLLLRRQSEARREHRDADCNTGTWSHRVERHVRRFIRRPENNSSIVLVGARGNAGSNGEGFIRPKQLWALVCPRRVGDEGTTPSLTPPVYFYAEVDPTARGCGCGVDALFGAGGACGEDPPPDVRAAAASCFAQANLTRLPWSLVAMEQQHEQRRQGSFASP